MRDDIVCRENGTVQCVAIFKVVRRCFETDDLKVAMQQAIAAEERGEFESCKKGLGYRYPHPHSVLVVPTAEENRFLAETLAKLRETLPALRDPKRIAAERLLLARDLSRLAMRLIREETANANHPEVIKAGENAFRVAKMLASGAGSTE